MEKKILPVIERRQLVSSGGSIVVAVPKEWLEQHSLKKGDGVLVVANGSLKIIPDDRAFIERLHKAVGGVKLSENED